MQGAPFKTAQPPQLVRSEESRGARATTPEQILRRTLAARRRPPAAMAALPWGRLAAAAEAVDRDLAATLGLGPGARIEVLRELVDDDSEAEAEEAEEGEAEPRVKARPPLPQPDFARELELGAHNPTASLFRRAVVARDAPGPAPHGC
jgi:hypothetical protein